MKIARIVQITVYHYGMVYKLEVDYILDSGKRLNCVHGEPDMADLVKDVICISGECAYSQVSLVINNLCDLLSDSERLIEVHGLASPSLIWQLSFVIMN